MNRNVSTYMKKEKSIPKSPKKMTRLNEKLIKLFSEFSKNLLISTPNELIRPHLKPPINPFHFRHYTPEQLERLLNKYGYYIQNWYSQKSGSNFKLNNGTDGKFIIAYCEKK